MLPANVRFNRTPYPKPFELVGGHDETVGAQTFTGEARTPPKPRPPRKRSPTGS